MSKTKASGELVLSREIDGKIIGQRKCDGYVDATALCKAAGKRWSEYRRIGPTEEFVAALSERVGIPTLSLIEVRPHRGGGTWVHPYIAVNLAQWLSPEFAVQVSEWVYGAITGAEPSSHDALRAELKSAIAAIREEFVAKTRAPALPPPGTYPACPRFTVRDRCRYLGWHTSTKDQRNKIRRLANAILHSRHDDTPDIIGGHSFYYAHQIACLDEAIVQVKADAEKKERDGRPRLPGIA